MVMSEMAVLLMKDLLLTLETGLVIFDLAIVLITRSQSSELSLDF